MLHRAFGDPEMEAIFSEAATVEAWLRTEAALARSQARAGELEPARAEAIAAACTLENVDLSALWADMANVGYPILPLVRQITERLPEHDRGSLHYGATTQDIMDTGLSLQLALAIDRLKALTVSLGDALARQVEVHADTVMAGRTHGQQAVPTTFGAKLATFLRQCTRLRLDLTTVRVTACLVSLHGAAGTSAGFGPKVEEVRADVARQLGLTPPDGPWHVTRDGLAAYGAVCARAASICARLAREIIDLSRTEIGEVSESMGHHRGASSTMPQKANPIDSESILGMAVSATAASASLYRAMEAGHERSAGEWQIEWHAIPQVSVLTAGCLLVAARVVGGLAANPQRMAANLDLEQGRTLAEAYMFRLAPELGREAAHDLVYEAAMASKTRGVNLRDALDEVAKDRGHVADISPADYTGQARDEAVRSVMEWRRSLEL
jgi:3-carboxy-cis,cis-muconate cycloisomerase